MISAAQGTPEKLARLGQSWELAEKTAAENRTTISRANWRLLMGGMHLALTEAEATLDVSLGLPAWLSDFWQ
jgi:hypothetical protein